MQFTIPTKILLYESYYYCYVKVACLNGSNNPVFFYLKLNTEGQDVGSVKLLKQKINEYHCVAYKKIIA